MKAPVTNAQKQELQDLICAEMESLFGNSDISVDIYEMVWERMSIPLEQDDDEQDAIICKAANDIYDRLADSIKRHIIKICKRPATLIGYHSNFSDLCVDCGEHLRPFVDRVEHQIFDCHVRGKLVCETCKRVLR